MISSTERFYNRQCSFSDSKPTPLKKRTSSVWSDSSLPLSPTSDSSSAITDDDPLTSGQGQVEGQSRVLVETDDSMALGAEALTDAREHPSPSSAARSDSNSSTNSLQVRSGRPSLGAYHDLHGSSMTSDMSSSSVEQILEERKYNPEEVLTNLGFSSAQDSLANRLPVRFLSNPTHATGIDVEGFCSQDDELKQLYELHKPFDPEEADHSFKLTANNIMKLSSIVSFWSRSTKPQWMQKATREILSLKDSNTVPSALPGGRRATISGSGGVNFFTSQGGQQSLSILSEGNRACLDEQGMYDLHEGPPIDPRTQFRNRTLSEPNAASSMPPGFPFGGGGAPKESATSRAVNAFKKFKRKAPKPEATKQQLSAVSEVSEPNSRTPSRDNSLQAQDSVTLTDMFAAQLLKSASKPNAHQPLCHSESAPSLPHSSSSNRRLSGDDSVFSSAPERFRARAESETVKTPRRKVLVEEEYPPLVTVTNYDDELTCNTSSNKAEMTDTTPLNLELPPELQGISFARKSAPKEEAQVLPDPGITSPEVENSSDKPVESVAMEATSAESLESPPPQVASAMEIEAMLASTEAGQSEESKKVDSSQATSVSEAVAQDTKMEERQVEATGTTSLESESSSTTEPHLSISVANRERSVSPRSAKESWFQSNSFVSNEALEGDSLLPPQHDLGREQMTSEAIASRGLAGTVARALLDVPCSSDSAEESISDASTVCVGGPDVGSETEGIETSLGAGEQINSSRVRTIMVGEKVINSNSNCSSTGFLRPAVIPRGLDAGEVKFAGESREDKCHRRLRLEDQRVDSFEMEEIVSPDGSEDRRNVPSDREVRGVLTQQMSAQSDSSGFGDAEHIEDFTKRYLSTCGPADALRSLKTTRDLEPISDQSDHDTSSTYLGTRSSYDSTSQERLKGDLSAGQKSGSESPRDVSVDTRDLKGLVTGGVDRRQLLAMSALAFGQTPYLEDTSLEGAAANQCTSLPASINQRDLLLKEAELVRSAIATYRSNASRLDSYVTRLTSLAKIQEEEEWDEESRERLEAGEEIEAIRAKVLKECAAIEHLMASRTRSIASSPRLLDPRASSLSSLDVVTDLIKLLREQMTQQSNLALTACQSSQPDQSESFSDEHQQLIGQMQALRVELKGEREQTKEKIVTTLQERPLAAPAPELINSAPADDRKEPEVDEDVTFEAENYDFEDESTNAYTLNQADSSSIETLDIFDCLSEATSGSVAELTDFSGDVSSPVRLRRFSSPSSLPLPVTSPKRTLRKQATLPSALEEEGGVEDPCDFSTATGGGAGLKEKGGDRKRGVLRRQKTLPTVLNGEGGAFDPCDFSPTSPVVDEMGTGVEGGGEGSFGEAVADGEKALLDPCQF